MTIEVKVPVLPESVADATVATWHKKPGDFVKRDENLVDIETDKVMLEVPAPHDGILKEIVKAAGSVVKGEEVIALFEVGAKDVSPSSPAPAATAPAAPVAAKDVSPSSTAPKAFIPGPATRRAVASGMPYTAIAAPKTARAEERVPMTRLRQRIAERLMSAQHNAAILTTFNEVNLKAISELRAKYKDEFFEKHGVKLGFMSFFVKAAVEALKRFPSVNASIDGTDVIYHNYFDIGVAVSTERGLVVPIIRDVENMSLAQIESAIMDYSKKARDNKLTVEDMSGGTFTVSNGGVFGSLLSTPIINPPQSAILGMHKIEDRPVVEDGQIVIRPMMYLAMSYDHRIIDGKESVSFLKTIKEALEYPAKLLLDI
ncbi:MAG: 2-oxoglutarate dehydrogenase complex dihydrolipoyllysine-residue succinyltransferase [Gammaproteobacteria bacterium]